MLQALVASGLLPNLGELRVLHALEALHRPDAKSLWSPISAVSLPIGDVRQAVPVRKHSLPQPAARPVFGPTQGCPPVPQLLRALTRRAVFSVVQRKSPRVFEQPRPRRPDHSLQVARQRGHRGEPRRAAQLSLLGRQQTAGDRRHLHGRSVGGGPQAELPAPQCGVSHPGRENTSALCKKQAPVALLPPAVSGMPWLNSRQKYNGAPMKLRSHLASEPDAAQCDQWPWQNPLLCRH